MANLPVEVIVQCINNLGIEHLFDVDTEYTGRRTSDSDMLIVTSKDGSEVEVFADRFELVTEDAPAIVVDKSDQSDKTVEWRVSVEGCQLESSTSYKDNLNSNLYSLKNDK